MDFENHLANDKKTNVKDQHLNKKSQSIFFGSLKKQTKKVKPKTQHRYSFTSFGVTNTTTPT